MSSLRYDQSERLRRMGRLETTSRCRISNAGCRLV